MANNISKISKIQLSEENYNIDVALALKQRASTDYETEHSSEDDLLKVTTKGYVDEVDTKKLDKAPDGTVNLIDDQGKINLHYLHDALIGQMKFGGITESTYSSGYTSLFLHTSDLLRCAMRTSGVEGLIDEGEWHISLNQEIPTLYESCLSIDFIVPEGFYFIVNCDIPQEDAVNFGIDSNIEKGDWLVSVGAVTSYNGESVQSHKWCKVDNTDAVKSVNGQIGTVNIDTGVMTLNEVTSDAQGNFTLAAGDNITITKGTNKLTIAATVPEQEQADWNENDSESLAYVKNRTHFDDSRIILDNVDPCWGGPPDSIGYNFYTGKIYTATYTDSTGTERESIRFTAAEDVDDTNHCTIGPFTQADGNQFNTRLYNDVYANTGYFDQIISNGGDLGGYFTFATEDIKQLDPKYIPIDNDTIKVEDGKLVGATKVDLSAVDQDVNIINGHDLSVDGNVTVHGDLYLDGDIGFGNLVVTNFEADYATVGGKKVLVEGDVVDAEPVDLSNYTGDVNINGNVAISGNLSFDGDFEIASLDAQSIKVNGAKVLVVPTTAADGSALQEGAVLVYRGGQWVAENPTA